MKYLNPKADLTFKRVFGEHPDLVMSLLNALLPLSSEQKITDLEYLVPEIIPESPLRKNTIVEKGIQASVERKGLEKGLAEGLEKGLTEGRKVEQQLIAANFKKQGIASEVIAQCTGLSMEEVDIL